MAVQPESELWVSLDLPKDAHLPGPLLSFPGIDVNIKDNRGLTALDTVRDLPSQKSQQIAALIEGVGHLTHCLGAGDGDPTVHHAPGSLSSLTIFPSRSHDREKTCERSR